MHKAFLPSFLVDLAPFASFEVLVLLCLLHLAMYRVLRDGKKINDRKSPTVGEDAQHYLMGHPVIHKIYALLDPLIMIGLSVQQDWFALASSSRDAEAPIGRAV